MLLITWLSLFLIKPNDNKILTDQALHEFLKCKKYVCCNLSHFAKFDSQRLEFNTSINSTLKTVLVNIDIKNLKQAIILYSTIVEGTSHVKNVKIKIIGAFSFYQKHKTSLEKRLLDGFYKKCFLDAEKLSKDRKNHFAIINISYGHSSYILINNLQNIMPNSDLLFISMLYFPVKHRFSFLNHLRADSPTNTLNINIKADITDQSNMVILIRNICNLHSHALGSYYYVVFQHFNINLISAVPFIFLSIGQNAFMSILKNETNFFDKKLLLMLIYPFFSCIVFLYDSIFESDSSQRAFVFGIATTINFKVGILFCLKGLLKSSIKCWRADRKGSMLVNETINK